MKERCLLILMILSALAVGCVRPRVGFTTNATDPSQYDMDFDFGKTLLRDFVRDFSRAYTNLCIITTPEEERQLGEHVGCAGRLDKDVESGLSWLNIMLNGHGIEIMERDLVHSPRIIEIVPKMKDDDWSYVVCHGNKGTSVFANTNCVTTELTDASAEDVLRDVAGRAGLNIAYDRNDLPRGKFTVNLRSVPWRHVVSEILQGSEVRTWKWHRKGCFLLTSLDLKYRNEGSSHETDPANKPLEQEK